ncbi:hypothetical protein HYT55_02975 [Candidatus Woesearchaeota archaeon]|nr:hypothetical protein [Candidatus Woesearchaeota archaeon]
MSERINFKAAAIVALSIIIGSYLIIYQKETLTGILFVAAGTIVSLSDVIKWLEELYNLFKTSEKEGDQSQEYAENSPQTRASQGGVIHQHITYNTNYYFGSAQVKNENENISLTIPKNNDGEEQNG